MLETIQILLVDDHEMVRRGVRSFLETQPGFHVLGEASNGEEALAQVAERAPDIVLLDLLMPGMGGIEAARRIKALSPNTQVIALTSSEEEEHILEAVTAGASAYILKNVGPRDLAAIIRRVASGEVVIEARIAALMVRSVQKRETSPARSVVADLTEREIEVLRLIAEGLTNVQIAARLYLSDKTVKTHVSNILSKLHLVDRTQAAVFAWKEGLLQ